MNTIPRSVSMRISPGKRPNQLKAEGANCSIAPTTSSTAPAIMIHFAMFIVPARYLIPSKIINHHELVGTIRLGSHITRRPLPCTHTFGQLLTYTDNQRTAGVQQLQSFVTIKPCGSKAVLRLGRLVSYYSLCCREIEYVHI